MPHPTHRELFAVPECLRWQRPAQADPDVVDAVEVASAPHGVLLRTTLGEAITISGGAWADFLAAVQQGEYDQMIAQ